MKKAIAVACSDIHLSDKAPVARAGEPDWHGKQREALDFIVDVSLEHEVPLIVAGDLFHLPRSTPAMEILAMEELAEAQSLLMIPGQHDLPNHLIENKGRSSYGVLTKHLSELTNNFPTGAQSITYRMYHFGEERGASELNSDIKIAVMHDLVWRGKEPYPGAPDAGNVHNLVESMPGYDFIVAGDNHKGFCTTVDDTVVVNCGSMMRRTAEQENYSPRCYILYDDKTAEPVYLPIEEDVFTREHRDAQKARDARVEAFVSHLKDIEVDLSFETNMDRFIAANKIESEVSTLIRGAMNV